ncbi:hypothetical protein O6P43_009897 [Quillaja saponaria]|uniref:Uncharacterized protein n=1 Tax=Quillaja saponaria TaxID=32244 RepID=A0AAD7VDV5_QUISA|nr:hypothetical protein O6P43_009897 [Quillaja saponaria]
MSQLCQLLAIVNHLQPQSLRQKQKTPFALIYSIIVTGRSRSTKPAQKNSQLINRIPPRAATERTTAVDKETCWIYYLPPKKEWNLPISIISPNIVTFDQLMRIHALIKASASFTSFRSDLKPSHPQPLQSRLDSFFVAHLL